MGQSFYLTQKMGQLRTASQTFSDLISATPTAFGLTAPLALSYKMLNDDFLAKFLLAAAPETRTKATILDRNDSARLLRDNASMLAKIIEATPTVTDGQKANLGLSVRATPAPAPAPGTCSDFKVKLLNDGTIEMSWRANNPPGLSGVTYQVWRRIGSEGAFEYAGATGLKKYFDATIPAGTPQVQYQVRGIRPTAAGGWAQYNVNFGQAPTGAATAAGVEANPGPKIAA